jgi:hypothetical protein
LSQDGQEYIVDDVYDKNVVERPGRPDPSGQHHRVEDLV